MGNFNRDRGGRPGGGRGFERRGFSGRGSSGPAQMFQATCDKCRMNCEVPFRPTNGRPIYCSNCFESNRGSDTGRYESRDFSSRRGSSFGSPRGGAGGEDRQMFDATCDNCHNSCKVPFRPSSDKPIYCSNCFEEKRGGSRNEGREQGRPQNNEQLEQLNTKLDKILMLLGSKSSESEVAAEAVEEVIEQTPQEQTVEAEVVKPARKKASKKK